MREMSYRESEVCSLMCKGLSNRQISETLFITTKTVKGHVTQIFRIMKVRKRSELIVLCQSDKPTKQERDFFRAILNIR